MKITRIVFLYLLSVFFFLSSCKNDKIDEAVIVYKKENASLFKDSVTLKSIQEVSFAIDSITPLTTNSIHFFTLGNKRYYTFLNSFNTALYIYDYDDKNLIKTIRLYNKGINSIGMKNKNQYLAHHVKSLDSIIICNNWDSQMFLVNDAGKVLDKVNIPHPGRGKFIVGTDASTQKPIIMLQNRVFILGNLHDWNVPDQAEVKNVISVSLTDKSIQRVFNRPKLFNHGTWGSLQFDLYGTFNEITHKFIYSFGGDPYIYETDNKNDIKRHYVGSKYFDKMIQLSNKKLDNNDLNSDIQRIKTHDLRAPTFSKIIFDPFNNVYYRSALLPLTEEQLKDPKAYLSRKETLIILDSNFIKIGEVLLPAKTYLTTMYFISKEGLHIAKLPELQKSESAIAFALFKLVKK